MTPAALTLVDLAVIYLIPLVFLASVWLFGALIVYILVRGPFEVDFKYDLLRKYDEKRQLPSGGGMRLSYLYVAELLLGDSCVQALLFYRLSRFFVTHRLRLLGETLHAFSKFLTHSDLSPYARLGRGVYLYHGLGTVIGKGTHIGERATICQGVTTGGGPRIGDDVKLWAGAKVIGKVSIGDRSEVGANAVVVEDVPADYVAVGVPATKLVPKVQAAPTQRERASTTYAGSISPQ